MTNSDVFTSLWGFFIFAILILLIVFVTIFLLIKSWKNHILVNLKQSRSRIRQFRTTRTQLENQLKAYSPSDPAPFGGHIQTLSEQLLQIDKKLRQLEQSYIHIQEKVRQLDKKSSVQQILSVHAWFLLERESKMLLNNADSINSSFQEAQFTQQSLHTVGWEIAIQVRDTLQSQEKAEAFISMLNERKLQGNALDEVTKQIVLLRLDIEKIPAYFFSATQTELLSLASKEDIITAYNIIQEHKPAVENIIQKTKVWGKAYENLLDQTALMETAYQAAVTALKNTPERIDVRQYADKLHILKPQIEDLQQKLSAPDVDELESLANIASHITNTAGEVNNVLREATKELSHLQNIYQDLNERISMLSSQFARTASRSNFPILWAENLDTLKKLNRQIKELNPLQSSLTPSEITNKLELARQNGKQLTVLENTYRRVENNLLKLTNFLNAPEFKQMEPWSAKIYQQVGIIQEFSIKNFPKDIEVETLPTDFKQLTNEIRYYSQIDTSTPLHEHELMTLLAGVENLFSHYNVFRSRFDQTWKIVEELQKIEENIAQKLADSLSGLQQLLLVASSNSIIQSTCEEEVLLFLESFKELSRELEHREAGTIHKKASKTNTLIRNFENTSKKWIKQLNKAISTQLKEIAETLAILKRIANISERVIDEGTNLLASRPLKYSIPQRNKEEPRIQLITLEIKRLSDLSQHCISLLNALEDIKTPLINSFTKAVSTKEYTNELLDNLMKEIHQRRDWPPTSVTLEPEQIQMQNLENEWEQMTKRPASAISLVAKFSSIDNRYQKITEKLHKKGGILREEALQIEEIENQLDSIEANWQRQWQTYQHNAFASEEIQNILEQAVEQRKKIRREYRRGNLNYSEIIYAMKALQKELRSTKVMIDDGKLLDIQGRIHPYR